MRGRTVSEFDTLRDDDATKASEEATPQLTADSCPKASKFDPPELASLVQTKWCMKWSPEQISDHLATVFCGSAGDARQPGSDLPDAL